MTTNCKYLVASALMEELNEFIHILTDRSANRFDEIQYGAIADGHKKIRVATFTTNKMGMPFNAAKLTEIVAKVNPCFIFFIGTCAGVKEKHEIGDVIIPNRVFSYESGKYQDGEFLPDLVSYETDGFLRGKAEEFNFQFKRRLTYKIYTDGDFASGSSVIDDKKKKKEIIDISSRKLYGIDMEAYAIACMNDIEKSSTRRSFLVAKSISDHAKKKETSEDEGGKEKAKINSADFVYRFIKFLEEGEPMEELQPAQVPVSLPPDSPDKLTGVVFQFDFSASYSDSDKITYKLKLMVKIRNSSNFPVVLESVSFKVGQNLKLHEKAGERFSKPAFLVSRKKTGEKIEDVYKDIMLLEKNESVFSCWIAFDDTNVTQKQLQSAINEHRAGKWKYRFTILNGGEQKTHMAEIEI